MESERVADEYFQRTRAQWIIYTKVYIVHSQFIMWSILVIAMVVWPDRIVEIAHHHLQVTSDIISRRLDSTCVVPMEHLRVSAFHGLPAAATDRITPQSRRDGVLRATLSNQDAVASRILEVTR